MRDALSLREGSRWEDGAALLRTAPHRVTAIDRRMADMFQCWLRSADMRLELWDGSSPWKSSATPVGDVVVGDRWALLKLLLDPDMQFGEMYTEGRVAIRGSLERVLEAASRLGGYDRLSFREWLALKIPRSNGVRLAWRNVHHHYDLGNDFYQLWLDRQLVYTCALFPEPKSTLEEAQIAKLDLVCRKLRLQPGDTVIEAGCGWGALALHMAREYGARVKAFNISHEQIRFARERAAAERLSDRVEFVEDDYRKVEGQFDVFVSVGMLEHVGVRHFESLSAVIRRVLRPETGRGLLHFIGRDRPRPLNAWTTHRIFPGAYPPAMAEVLQKVLEPARQSIHHVENLRLHYARTLEHWRARFERSEQEVRTQFGDAFYRAWDLYLAASQASFRTGSLQLFQIVFAPAGREPLYAAQPFPETAIAP
ncbi:MAG TPA: cyclopropane-fatty-acyl-phospholipid synthase family protein [Vicinamibacterales bacterium]